MNKDLVKNIGQKTGLILIQGASGMGKTIFAKKIIQYGATERNALILNSRCSPFENIQFNALDEIMDQLGCFLEYSGRSFLNRIPLQTPPIKETITRIANRLNTISQVRPVFMFIDDFQWADDGSIDFLTELMLHLNLNKILLLLNILEEKKAVCKRISKKITPHTINLSPLTRISSQQAVEYLLGNGHENTNQIITESAGIPYFIDALSLFVKQNPSGKYGKKGPILSGFIDASLSQLPDKAQAILEFAAVAGTPIDFESALSALNMGKKNTALIRLLIKRRFLRYVAKDTRPAFALYHRLIEKSILKSLSPEQKKAMGLRCCL